MRVDQAVVLIAPEGRPGKRILGLDPLERVLLTASQAGVTDFILVGADSRRGGYPCAPPEGQALLEKGHPA